MKLIGNGLVTIPAHIARCIPTLLKELPKDCPIVYREEIAGLVRQQLCSWCDGSGWQPVNCMENVVACSHCSGDGLEPPKNVPEIFKLGRFKHHPDPAVDFCVEVDVIGGLAADVAAKLEKKSVVLERIEKAMRFRVGGDERAVAAKALLRKTESELRKSLIRRSE
jgi:hypothetical protein